MLGHVAYPLSDEGGFGADVAATALITGRLDGSVYCGPTKLEPKNPVATSDPGRVREIIGLPGSDVFALTDSTGAVYAWDCTGGDKMAFRSEGNGVLPLRAWRSPVS